MMVTKQVSLHLATLNSCGYIASLTAGRNQALGKLAEGHDHKFSDSYL